MISNRTLIQTATQSGGTSLGQGFKPVLVQALVPELAVEALDVAVLHRSARLDEYVSDTMSLRPSHEEKWSRLVGQGFDVFK